MHPSLPPDEIAFSVDATPFTWNDVLDDARRRGAWAVIEQEAAEGLACEAHDSALGGTGASQAELEAEGARFRYERGLTTAVAMNAWLAQWNLSVDDWQGEFRRMLLRRTWAPRAAELVAAYPTSSEERERAARTHAICSDQLQRLADSFAMRAAAAASIESENVAAEPRFAGAAIADVERRFAVYRARVITEAALVKEIAARHLDWTRVRYRTMSFDNANAAREAAMCMRDDGMDLADVAAEVRLIVTDEMRYLEDVDAALRGRVLGANVGEIIGPFEIRGRFMLCALVEKRLPTHDDPDVRARAERGLVERGAASEADRRVRWAR